MSEPRTLLLTDVVDSTRLTQALGDARAAQLWAAHDRLARDLLPAWRGREIDKSDGMLLLFEAAADAVGYALAYQRALATLVPPLRARAGLHAGPVTLRENSPADVARGAKPLEVEGAAKATAARVMSIANGGQVLLSAEARQALDAAAMPLQSHGHWRLKGIEEPAEVFEAGDAGTQFAPPPDGDKAYRVARQGDLWLPVREIRHSLPAERDGFVGRGQALADLALRLQGGARLVSVLGLGGTGKTRLVTRFGWGWLGDYAGGVWFCDLAAARGADGIASAVAQGLDVSLGKGDPVEQLGHAIAGHGLCLVILDNFEQVARHAPETLGHWLDRAGEARFIVTTREVLGLAGEEVLALPPLPPADAADLFLQRARAANPRFQPNADDGAAIAPLVALLDGLPLAIELAAARARLMSPRMLLQRMSDRFKLLASKGGRLDRQATLRAAFDWSWDLLRPAEKAALAQLSVFEGGFTLEAAEAVLDLSGHDHAPWTADAVNSLVDKSFVRPRGDDRLDLLVSVQVYAAEHLQSEGRYPGSGPQALASAQARHGAWFAALGPERSLEGNCADLDNLIAACRRAVTWGEGDVAAGALEGAWAALYQRGPFESGAALAESVCAMPGLGDRAAARARSTLAHALVVCGRSGAARALYDSALAIARAVGDRRLEARVRALIGLLLESENRMDESRAENIAALQIARELGDRGLQCSTINGLGTMELAEGRYDEALAHFEQALALARELGDRRVQGTVLGNLSNLHFAVGRMDEARVQGEATLAIARETGHRKLEGNTLCNLGMLHLVLGRLDEADAASKAALAVAREVGNARTVCIVLCNLGILAERMDRPDEAQAHFEAALRMARDLDDPRSEGEFLGYLGLLHARQGRHDDARRCLDSGEVMLREASDRLGLGVLLCSRAEAMHLAGAAAAARASLDDAATIAAAIGAGPASEIGSSLARVRALLDPQRP
jgi:predicted ATPase/class 3 adenylate cyclase/Tfp pilus assembly protein PilF